MSQPSTREDRLHEVDDSSIRSETIILATADADLDSPDAGPESIRSRLLLKNRLNGIETRLILFDEHYLACRSKTRNGRRSHALLNLRYLDARPEISRTTDFRPLLVAGGAVLVAGLCGVLAYLSVTLAWSVAGMLLFAAAAVGALILFAHRNTESATFVTAEGRVPALRLKANIGCIKECRKLVPELVDSIKAAQASLRLDRNAYLRREMREHYRLQETGVISENACATGTRRVLKGFE